MRWLLSFPYCQAPYQLHVIIQSSQYSASNATFSTIDFKRSMLSHVPSYPTVQAQWWANPKNTAICTHVYIFIHTTELCVSIWAAGLHGGCIGWGDWWSGVGIMIYHWQKCGWDTVVNSNNSLNSHFQHSFNRLFLSNLYVTITPMLPNTRLPMST